MLTLLVPGGEYIPLQCDDYYIKQKAFGVDELWFSVNVHDPIYQNVNELSQITDQDGQKYLVRKIDGGAKTATVEADLDLDEWKAGMHVAYHSDSLTCLGQIEAVKPTGWSVIDHSGINIRRTIEGDFTPFDIVMRCAEVYGVYLRFDTAGKTLELYPQSAGEPLGTFATRQLNLKEINYKGKAEEDEYCTRLYCYGKDGMTFESINDGKPYVDNTEYSSRIVSAVWRDERYTVPADLLADGTRRLKAMAFPVRSYDCEVVDLKAVDPERYNNLDFALFSSAVLVDEYKGNAIIYQVVERWIYPHYPEKNRVIFSDVPVSVQGQVTQIKDAMENPSSTFQQTIMAAAVNNASGWLTASNGYVVAVRNTDGSWKELLFMDTNDTATAQNVLRINENGLGFSTTGVNGPYTNAWTIDGQLVADFVTAGTMTADRIRGGTLELGGLDNEDGVLIINDAAGNEIGRWDKDGITAQKGEFGAWFVNSDGKGLYTEAIDGTDRYVTYLQPYKSGTGVNTWCIAQMVNGNGRFYVKADGSLTSFKTELLRFPYPSGGGTTDVMYGRNSTDTGYTWWVNGNGDASFNYVRLTDGAYIRQNGYVWPVYGLFKSTVQVTVPTANSFGYADITAPNYATSYMIVSAVVTNISGSHWEALYSVTVQNKTRVIVSSNMALTFTVECVYGVNQGDGI